MRRSLLVCVLLCGAAPKPSGEPILLVARDLPAGAVLTLDDVAMGALPAGVPLGSIIPANMAMDANNKRLRVPLLKGDPVMAIHVESVGDDAAGAACVAVGSKSAADQVARAKAAVMGTEP
ncbi:MAG: hypothetical protein JNK82_04020 [Myxococcaceae bacterium]|nr:hypothetical protein [Myxococcaceae bacterium]